MYFNATKCSSLVLCCLIPLSLLAKNVKPVAGQGLQKPLCFIENKGQVTDQSNNPRADIQYKLSAPGMSLYVGSGKLHYQFNKVDNSVASAPKVSGYQMDVTLLGADPNATIVNESGNSYYENYYNERSSVTAHSFNKIRYKNVYPGIDWVLYVKDGKVEYDFVVKEGANVNDIRIKYDGATALNVARNGGIIAQTPMGTVSEGKPYTYETATGKAVTSRFNVHDNVVTFETGAHKGGITIDPTVLWGTYYGGTAEDVVTSVKITTAGVVFAGGYTASFTGIATSGPGIYDNTYGGGAYDAFMVCLSTTGVRLWATYFGGAGVDRGTCVGIDNAGTYAYLAGYTNSTGPGLSNTYQVTNNGGNDGFILKLNASNGARMWSSFYGGTGDDRINSIAIDAFNSVYVAGVTSSTASIASGGVYQTALSGPTDAFVAKLGEISPTSAGRTWGTYYGGSAQEEAFGIALDAANNPVITGQTNSVLAIATSGAYQASLSGTNDAFVAKMNSSATTLTWATYFGGPGTEQGNGVVVNTVSGAVAVVGNTTSTTNIATPNAHQTTYGGGVQDAFLCYLTSGGVMTWSTYYGGSSLDYGEDVCLDPYRNIIIAGGTFSANGIASAMGNQTTIGGDYDAYAAKFMVNSQRLWGTYFGNALYDYAFGVACNNAGQMVLGGHTTSTSGISTVGAAQPVYAGGIYDGFVTKFVIDTFVTINQPYIDTILCAGGPTFNLPYTVNINFRIGNNFVAQLSNASGSFATPIAIGSVTSNTSGIIPVAIPAGTPAGTGYRIRIVTTGPAVASPDDFKNIQVVSTLPATYAWGTTPVCVGATIQLNDTATYKINSYSWNGPAGFTSAIQNPTISSASLANAGAYSVTTTHNGCPPVTSTVDIVVNSFIPPTPTVTATSPACQGSAINFTATSGLGSSPVTYHWSGPAGFTSTLQNPSIASAAFANSGKYYITDTFGGCPSDKDSILVTVLATTPVSLMIDVDPNDTVCAGTMVTFTATAINGGISPTYQWTVGGMPVVGAISPTWSTSTLSDGDMVTAILHSSVTCPSPVNAVSNSIKMNVINNAPIVYITATPGTSVPAGSNITFTSTVFNGGIGALYQWQRNGVNIPGATNSTYTLVGVTTRDTIRLLVASTMGCAVPDAAFSNSLIVHTNVGVAEIASMFSDLALYPNPNTGTFSIKGAMDNSIGNSARVEVLNTLGQIVYSGPVSMQGNAIEQTVNMEQMPNGVYLLRISADGGSRSLRFSISK
jgi:hypothetical protein